MIPPLPWEVLAIHDTGPDTYADRYTIVLRRDVDNEERPWWSCLEMSSNPNHPQGVSMYGRCMRGRHLGKRIGWVSLPENVRNHVVARLQPC